MKALLPRLHYFDEGTCIVHHMFGAETTNLVRKAYGDALLTAHFEVQTLQPFVLATCLPCLITQGLAGLYTIHSKLLLEIDCQLASLLSQTSCSYSVDLMIACAIFYAFHGGLLKCRVCQNCHL